jgi:hypothetical protein
VREKKCFKQLTPFVSLYIASTIRIRRCNFTSKVETANVEVKVEGRRNKVFGDYNEQYLGLISLHEAMRIEIEEIRMLSHGTLQFDVHFKSKEFSWTIR